VDDVEGPEDPNPQEIEIDDLNIHDPDPAPIEVETAQAAPIQPGAPFQEPVHLPELRRSTRDRTQTNPGYVPSLTGSKYLYAVVQLESHGVLHPDAHMLTQHDFYQSGPDVVAMAMTQLSLKARLKAWGNKTHTAARNEMKQLHMRDTFKPMHWRELSHTQRQMVLESHMFLKEKRNGKTKGRTVAGGNKQRGYISKEDASSPAVATESTF
jgi:hypothetical protein